MSVIIFLFSLTILVFVHELGHFLSAKFFGIRVDEFAIGFPPRLLSKKIGETVYSVNLIPFGGYVKIWGEDIEENVVLNEEEKKRNLSYASKWKQAVVLLSGITFNIVFAWILISISLNLGLFSVQKENSLIKIDNPSIMIISILDGSPAEKAGLKVGDKILAIDSQEIKTVKEVQDIISSQEKNVFYFERLGERYNKEIIAEDGFVEGKKAVGISMEAVGVAKYGFFESFYYGAKLIFTELINITIGLKNFIINIFSSGRQAFNSVSGPVGLAKMSGEAMTFGVSYFLSFVSFISLNLAIINLVPFPALDGGRVFFLIIESIIRRKIKPIIFNSLNGVGFLLLMALMVAITIKDVVALFK